MYWILNWQIQSYNKLERHLRDAVEATEHKQKQLLSREAEVNIYVHMSKYICGMYIHVHVCI